MSLRLIRPRRVIVLFSFLILVALVLSCGDDAVRPPGGGGSQWEQLSGTLTEGTLSSVWVSPSRDIYMTAYDGLFHFDGHGWSRTQLSTRSLNAVWGFADDDVWVAHANYVSHFDGSRWTHEKPLDGFRVVDLWGGDPDELFAVGSRDRVLRYNGKEWKPLYTPADGYVTWRAIWGYGRSDVVFAGNWDDFPPQGAEAPQPASFGLIGHYDGSTISRIDTLEAMYLYDIAGTSDDNLYAVGGKFGGGVVLHYDGGAWTPVPIDVDAALYAVWVGESGRVVAAGKDGFVVYHDDQGWRVERYGYITLHSIAGSSIDRLTACGGLGSLLTYDGHEWTPWFKNANRSYQGVFSLDGDRVMIVGWEREVDTRAYNGVVRSYDGDRWTETTVAPGGILHDVWAWSPTEAYAVGKASAIYHLQGATWAEIPNNTQVTFHSVWGFGPGDAVAVGTRETDTGPWEGVVVRISDGTVEEDTTFAWIELLDVWGTGSEDIFAVGRTSVFHFDGFGWTQTQIEQSQEDPVPADLRGVSGTSPTDVFAASGNGQIYHFDGDQWSKMTDAGFGVSAIHAIAHDDVFAAGRAGRIVHFDGTTWTRSESGSASNHLNGIGGNQHVVYAAGDRGTVLRRSTR
jgi:hypothetical protein